MTVGKPGGMRDDLEDIAQPVREQVTFAPHDFLVVIVTALTAALGR